MHVTSSNAISRMILNTSTQGSAMWHDSSLLGVSMGVIRHIEAFGYIKLFFFFGLLIHLIQAQI
jgi:hypothetical protein